MSNALIYDIEIHRGIPPKDGSVEVGIAYCAGWRDHANMGVTVIGAYDYAEDRYRVFCPDNHAEFFALAKERSPLVGYNSIPFDNAVLAATYPQHAQILQDDPPGRCYDLLREIWRACGLGPKFEYPSHAGYSLDQVCMRNFGQTKSGNGALAPALWQRGQIGQVIDYCLNDVRLTRLIFDRAIHQQEIIIPKEALPLLLRRPE
jgi:hypothetical protein